MRKSVVGVLLFLFVSTSVGISSIVWLRSVRTAEAHQHMNAGVTTNLPSYVQSAAPEVQVAYQFAIDHPETLKQIPCYCGCEKTLGHEHNLACYITGFNPDGSVADYSDHAVYCAVCVDTTQMVIKMRDEGKSIQEIHDAVDTKYGYMASHS